MVKDLRRLIMLGKKSFLIGGRLSSTFLNSVLKTHFNKVILFCFSYIIIIILLV